MNGINETKQEFLKLDVDEVSIVDNPAIEEEWLVIKRTNEKSTINSEALAPPQVEVDTEKAVWTRRYINDLPDSAFLYIESGGKKDEEGKTVPRSLRHFPYKDGNGKIDLPHLRNAIARIPQAKIPGLTKEDLARLQDKARKLLQKEREKQEVKKMDVKDVSESNEITTEAEVTKDVAAEDTDTTEAEVNKTEETESKQEVAPAPTPEPEADSEPVTKSIISISDDEIVINDSLLREVTKAKRFSKGRMETLRSATKAMIALLKEVDPETLQKFLGDDESQTQKSVEQEGQPKSDEPDFTEAITAAVSKAIEPLNARIKELESTKATPKSSDGDQQAEVKKSNDNIWAGSAIVK